MKKLALFLSIIMVFSVLSPFAAAMELLEKPGAGQVIFTEADNSLDYRADFPLSALTGAFREGDDLRLEFPAARLTLRGFFAPLGEWRSISFSDGNSIGGADFDESGSYTGSFHNVLDKDKSGQSAKQDALAAGVVADVIWLRYSSYGIEVLYHGESIWGELRDSCMEAASLITPYGPPELRLISELKYEFLLKDGGYTPVRAYTEFANGLSALTVNPACIYLADSGSIHPLSEGRAAVSYSNSYGDTLLTLELQCQRDESGALNVLCLCPNCGEDQGGTLHFQPCGHYSCADGFDAAGHGIAPCGVAGHCASEEGHEKCSNCHGYICDGKNHGIGACEHAHDWVPISLTSSRCASCGYVYTRK